MNSKIPNIDHDLYILKKVSLVVGILSFIIGAILVHFDYLNQASILFLITIFFFSWNYILRNKYKNYKKIYTKYLSEYNAMDILNYGSFEFTLENLIYKSKRNKEIIDWNEFSKFEIIDSQHVLLLNKNSDWNLIISQTEMDKSDFIKILQFIKNRLK
ncbi:MAG: hypothetical protein GYB35_17310 [Algicola sp.]|nr:hypothetical protein [Algicola sp.]